MSNRDFAGAADGHMYCLIMAIRPDTLPTDPAAVPTEKVLALDAENEQLRTVVQTFKDMIFRRAIAEVLSRSR